MSPTPITSARGAVLASGGTERSIRHFHQVDLSRRWNVSPRTLERWRWLKQGPAFLKVGGRVVYRLEDIEAYERQHLRLVVERDGGSR